MAYQFFWGLQRVVPWLYQPCICLIGRLCTASPSFRLANLPVMLSSRHSLWKRCVLSGSFLYGKTAGLGRSYPRPGPCQEFFRSSEELNGTGCCLQEGHHIPVAPQGRLPLVWLCSYPLDHLSPTNKDDYKGCCEEDGRDRTTYCDAFLQFVLGHCYILCCVAEHEFAKIAGYEILDAEWYPEEIKSDSH